MKKVVIWLIALFISTSIFAQAPQKMSYQAVIRNANSNLLLNTAVGMRISILQGSINGTAVYVETQNPSTNSNGLVTIEIGGGTATTGTFATINWANGPYFIKTETDPSNGANYSIIGTSQLLSVPYALYAANAINYSSGSGISISGGTISNTSPNQSVAISGAGITTVSGTYPNYTVYTSNHVAGSGISVNGSTITNTAPNQTFALSATGISSVTGSYPNFTVNTPNHIAGNGISVTGNTITNTAPNQSVSLIGIGSVTVSGSYPSYSVSAPVYALGNGLTSNGYTLINSAPNQTVTLAGAGISTVTGTYPNYTVNTNPYQAGSGISISGSTITNTSPNQTVNIFATGGTSVTGTYPNYTVSSAPRGKQLFTSSGTYTVPFGITTVWVNMSGGGGGGNGSGCSNAAPGGGACALMASSLAVIPGQTIAVTVGLGGATVGTASLAGNTGGTSSFGTLVTAGGPGGGCPSVGFCAPGIGCVPGGAQGMNNLPNNVTIGGGSMFGSGSGAYYSGGYGGGGAGYGGAGSNGFVLVEW